MKKQFTLEEFRLAIAQNGLPKTKNRFFYYKGFNGGGFGTNLPAPLPITGACAIGQACINLGIDPGSINNSVENTRGFTNASMFVVRRNDHTDLTLEEIAAELAQQGWYDPTVMLEAEEFTYNVHANVEAEVTYIVPVKED